MDMKTTLETHFKFLLADLDLYEKYKKESYKKCLLNDIILVDQY